jgi:hypothetical protein
MWQTVETWIDRLDRKIGRKIWDLTFDLMFAVVLAATATKMVQVICDWL